MLTTSSSKMGSCTPNYTTRPMTLSWLHLVTATKLKPSRILITIIDECIGPDLMTAALKIFEQVKSWWDAETSQPYIHLSIVGEVIALDDDEQSIYLEDSDPEDKWQKWKVNKKTGVILNRATKTPLSSFSNEVPCVASDYTGNDCFEFIDAKVSYNKFLSTLSL